MKTTAIILLLSIPIASSAQNYQGMSEEEVLAANPLSKYDSYGWGFITTERMTSTFFRSLTTD